MSGSALLQAVDFKWPCRVYYEDTDGQGFLYHSRCLNFFERARTEWVRSAGVVQSEWLAKKMGFVVTTAELQYHKPAFLDDALIATVQVLKMGRSRISLGQELVKMSADGEALHKIVSGQFTIAFVDLAKQKPVAMPAILSEALEATCA